MRCCESQEGFPVHSLLVCCLGWIQQFRVPSASSAIMSKGRISASVSRPRSAWTSRTLLPASPATLPISSLGPIEPLDTAYVKSVLSLSDQPSVPFYFSVLLSLCLRLFSSLLVSFSPVSSLSFVAFPNQYSLNTVTTFLKR